MVCLQLHQLIAHHGGTDGRALQKADLQNVEREAKKELSGEVGVIYLHGFKVFNFNYMTEPC